MEPDSRYKVFSTQKMRSMEEIAAAVEHHASRAGARSMTVDPEALVGHHAILAVRSIVDAATSEWLAIGLCSDSELGLFQG